MSLKPADIDNIIQLLTQITEALSKTDFLSPEEQEQLNKYNQYELWRKIELQNSRLGVRPFDEKEDEQRRKKVSYDKDVLAALKNKLWKAKQEYIESTIKPLQKDLDLFLTPRWSEILQLRTQKQFSRELVESFINTNIGTSASSLNTQKEIIVNEFDRIKAKLEYLLDKAGGEKAEKIKVPPNLSDSCQTPEELAEAIDNRLKQGGMRRDIYEQGVLKKTVYDDFETRRLYGIALSQYNRIRKSYPKLPLPQIDTSDSLSALAQLQQLCAECDGKTENPAETKQNVAPAKVINIKNFKGILGDVQAENVQTGDSSSIHKQLATDKKPEKWYHNRTIQSALISVAALIFISVIGWLLSYYYFKTNLVQQRGNPKIQASRIPQTPHKSVKPTQTIQEPAKVQKPQLIGIGDVVNEPNKR